MAGSSSVDPALGRVLPGRRYNVIDSLAGCLHSVDRPPVSVGSYLGGALGLPEPTDGQW